MNIGAALLPFAPAELAAPAAGGLAAPAAPAASATPATVQTVPAELAAFASVLALAIQPRSIAADAFAGDTTQEPSSDADESGATDDASPAGSTAGRKHDDASPLGTAGDVAGVANTLNASMIVRDLGALQPQFRAKLERVISRMSDEYGHTVSVSETYRSQARQDQLLLQGRTTSGPIVTWTSHSLHTQGRAADLLVDGKWNNPEGFGHLQEIATQEGLATLGPRDPGHVEMREDPLATIAALAHVTEVGVSGGVAVPPPAARGTGAFSFAPAAIAAPVVAAKTAAQPQAVIASATTQVAPIVQIARVAQVAQVAPVAPVAQVAQIARVAQLLQVAPIAPAVQLSQSSQPVPAVQVALTSNQLAGAQSTSAPRNPSAATNDPSARHTTARLDAAPATSAVQSENSSAGGSSGRREERRDPNLALTTGHASKPAASPPESQQAAVAQPVTTVAGTSATADNIGGVNDSGAAARAAAVLALQDARDAQPISHMVLQLDNGNGGLDRIRVGLHGTTVGATIDMRDPAAATELADNIHQLASALQSRGLDADSLRVRVAGAVAPAPPPDITRVVAAGGDLAGPARGTLFAQETSSSSRSRDDARGQRSHQDQSGQRARKDQQGDKQ